MKEQIHITSKLKMNIDNIEVKCTFGVFFWSKKIATIKTQSKRLGFIKTLTQFNIYNDSQYLVEFVNKQYFAHIKGNILILSNSEKKLITLKKGKDNVIEIFNGDDYVGEIKYPKVHFIKSTVVLNVKDSIENSFLKYIKLLFTVYCAHNFLHKDSITL